MSRRPLLLIDVDGVLNPLLGAEAFDLHVLVPAGWTGPPLHVQLSPRHGEWLLALTDLFDLVWATTWEDSANVLIAPRIGLPGDLPVVPFGGPGLGGAGLDHEWGISFKSPAVARWVGDRPFAWLDDTVSEADVRWFGRRPGIGPFHLQSINPLVGLTAEDCAAVRAWAMALEVR